MCFFLLSAVIFAFCVKQFAEPDIWWHLRSAQDLLQTHNFVPLDTYSFTAAGAPRMNFEWLSELAYLAGFRAALLPGILIIYFGILVLIYGGVYYRSCKAASNCKNATLATLLGIFLGVVSIGPRTLLFGWLCMIALLIVLDRFRKTGTGLWVLPPLFVLWINLHPSWVFGVVVLLLTVASGLVEHQWGRVIAVRWTGAELKQLSLAVVMSFVVLFANPFGYKLVLYPFDFLFRQQRAAAYIEEWQGVDLSTGDGKLALLVLIGLIAVALLSRRTWRLDEVLLTLFALSMALLHARFLFFAGLILPTVLAQRVELFMPYDPEIDKPLLNAGIIVCIVAGMIAFFPSQKLLESTIDAHYPSSALRFMRGQQLTGNIFNSYLWGGYMEWKAPELKPFIDGRTDIFVYNGALDDHGRIMTIEDPLKMLDKYHISYVLLQPQRPLTYILEHSHGWQKLYSDDVAVVFGRTSTVRDTSQFTSPTSP